LIQQFSGNIMSARMTAIGFVCSEDFSPSTIRTKVLTTNLFYDGNREHPIFANISSKIGMHPGNRPDLISIGLEIKIQKLPLFINSRTALKALPRHSTGSSDSPKPAHIFASEADFPARTIRRPFSVSPTSISRKPNAN
jgi:hypothetical protein